LLDADAVLQEVLMSRISACLILSLVLLAPPSAVRAAEAIDPATAKAAGSVLFYDIRALGVV
jgi:hypothetical protein